MVECDVVIVGTGSLARSVCAALARGGLTLSVQVLGRSRERAQEVATIAGGCCYSGSGAVRVTASPCEMSREGLYEVLAAFQPRVVLTCSSLQSPWELHRDRTAWTETVARVGLGLTIPLQALIAFRVAQAVAAQSPATIHLNAAMPDVVNSILAGGGLPVLCGVGNAQTLAAAIATGLPTPNSGRLRLLAHHFHLRRPHRRADEALAWHGGSRLVDVAARLTPVRSCAGPRRNRIAGAMCAQLLERLLSDVPYYGNVPGPLGLPGGYPVKITDATVRLDLPSAVSFEQALALNARWSRLDGLGCVNQSRVQLCPIPGDPARALEFQSLLSFDVSDIEAVCEELVEIRTRLSGQISRRSRNGHARAASPTGAQPVELRSDTKTMPSPAMREAIASAAVGDEQSGEDPTVLELERRVASMLGHEAGLFLPSGTMCNLVAMCLHLRAGGEEVILARQSHLMRSEAGGAAVICGAMFNPIDTPSGIFDEEQLRAAIRPPDVGAPRSRVLAVEQTVNWTGGAVWPVERLRGVTGLARVADLRVHLDGARLMNAAVALDVNPAAFTALCDTATLDFTKGLGAPLGAVLTMPGRDVARAKRFKRMLGGGLRQAGLCAAACMHSLDHNIARLPTDHANAQRLARAIARVPGCSLPPHGVHTNIVLVTVPDAARFSAMLRTDGVLISQASSTEVRFVTHLDIDEESVSYVEHVLAKYNLLRTGGRGRTDRVPTARESR